MTDSDGKFPDRFGPDVTVSEVDLDAEEVYVGGRRLTEEGAERLAQQTLAEIRRQNLTPGRKSLSGDGTHSPRVGYRLSRQEFDDALQIARAEGLASVHELGRKALAEHIARYRLGHPA